MKCPDCKSDAVKYWSAINTGSFKSAICPECGSKLKASPYLGYIYVLSFFLPILNLYACIIPNLKGFYGFIIPFGVGLTIYFISIRFAPLLNINSKSYKRANCINWVIIVLCLSLWFVAWISGL